MSDDAGPKLAIPVPQATSDRSSPAERGRLNGVTQFSDHETCSEDSPRIVLCSEHCVNDPRFTMYNSIDRVSGTPKASHCNMSGVDGFIAALQPSERSPVPSYCFDEADEVPRHRLRIPWLPGNHERARALGRPASRRLACCHLSATG